MSDFDRTEWLERRIKERMTASVDAEIAGFDKKFPVVNAGGFAQQVADIAETMHNKVSREGPSVLGNENVTTDMGIILRQLMWTYNLLRWINADDTRHGSCGYREAYSFVSLPLIRTLIDGFYNCTALLDDPSRSRAFRISGFFRLREALREDQRRYADHPDWQEDFSRRQHTLREGLKADGLIDADLDDKKNRWPLLGSYLKEKPTDTQHKRLLRAVSLGFWQEYSSISHASYDGLVQLFPAIAFDKIPHEMRTKELDGARQRLFFMHYARAAVLLLALSTEIQHRFRFRGARIDERLREIWSAMLQLYEAKELYDMRYAALLRTP